MEGCWEFWWTTSPIPTKEEEGAANWAWLPKSPVNPHEPEAALTAFTPTQAREEKFKRGKKQGMPQWGRDTEALQGEDRSEWIQ